MKIKVNRQLNQGKFRVNFEVSDFTSEELSKMASFGVPLIEMIFQARNGPMTARIPINQINPTHEAVFPTFETAKEYEEKVFAQIRSSMERLRQSKDDFSSSEEVVL